MNVKNHTHTFITLGAVVIVVITLVSSLFALHKIAPDRESVIHEFSAGLYAETNTFASSNKVNLPHDWRVEGLNVSRLWYKFDFLLNEMSSSVYALYLPVVSENAVIYLNGSEIGNGGSVVEPIARNWPRPLIFPIGADFLNVGKNELVVQLVSDPVGRGLLPVMYLGDWAALQPSYNFRKLLKLTGLGASVVILLIVAVFLVYMTWRLKESSEYAWGAAIFLGLSGHSLPGLFVYTPVPPFLWEWWQDLCIGFTILFMLIFVNRYFNIRNRALEISCTWFLIVASIIALYLVSSVDYQSFYYTHAAGFWGVCGLVMGAIPITVTFSNAIGGRDISALYMLCVGAVLFVLGAHDAMFVNGIVTRQNGYLIHYTSALVAILITAILISRLITSSESLEELNRSLESRIEKSNRELAASYEKVREMEREQLLAAERERFGRDMHDGLGGHLSTALALAESKVGPEEPLTKTIRDATDEMRLMLDTASAMDEDIGMVIGSLRARLQSQAEIAGFTLLWEIEDTSPINKLGPGTALSLIRIVQEAVTNAFKHSGGDIIRVRVFDRNGIACLEIADNGECGNLQTDWGNGVRNMGTRAAELGASVSFDLKSELGGLSVCVVIPSAIESDFSSG